MPFVHRRLERRPAPEAKARVTELTASALAVVPARYFPISPYRTADSRPDTFGPGATIDWCVLNDLTMTRVLPLTARAVSGIFTIADTVGSGFLSVFPAGAAWPGNSSINWWASNLLLANSGIVALGVSPTTGAGSVTMFCSGGGRAAVIADITGYFA